MTPVSPSHVLAMANAEAALNGPMFGVCSGQDLPHGNAQYAVSQCDTLSYAHRDAGAGLQTPSAYDTRGMTISIVDGQAQAASGASYPPNASVAVQLYPALIASGRVVASRDIDTDRVWRSGLAILQDGQLLFAVGKMGMFDFAQALAGLGAVQAGYTDGGGSSALVASGESAGSSENRPVASWLLVKKSGLVGSLGALPSQAARVLRDPRALLWAGGAAVLVTLLLVRSSRRQ